MCFSHFFLLPDAIGYIDREDEDTVEDDVEDEAIHFEVAGGVVCGEAVKLIFGAVAGLRKSCRDHHKHDHRGPEQNQHHHGLLELLPLGWPIVVLVHVARLTFG